MTLHGVAILLIAAAMPAHAATAIGDDHKIPWHTDSGVSNGPVQRTVVFTNYSSGASAATINAGLALCPSNQIVQLGAGTWTLTASLEIENDYITLRGAGISNTILYFTAVDRGCMVYMGRNEFSDLPSPGAPHEATWHTGFTRGTTTIKLSNVTGLSVGRLMGLDQLEDLNLTRTTGTEGNNHARDSGARGQMQLVEVTGISGTNVTFYPSVYATNWATANSPEAFWLNGDHTKFSSIEGLSITNNGSGSQQGVHFKNAANCWAYNVRSCNSSEGQFVSRLGFRNTVKHCIAYGADGGVGSYGASCVMSAGFRVEDTISDHIGPTFLIGAGSIGTVFFGNYVTNSFYNAAEWLVEGTGTHGTHCQYTLVERCHTYNYWNDFIRGSGSDNTLFRSRVIGRGWNSEKPGITTQNLTPVVIQSTNYYANIIANVLGDNSHHSAYELVGQTTGDESVTIYVLGYITTDLVSGHDGRVTNLLNRAFNYDTVTDSVVSNGLVAADVPNSYLYPSGLPATHHDGTVYWGNRPTIPFDPLSPSATLTVSESYYTNIPAGYWHRFGTNPPAGAAGGPTVTNLTIRGAGFKVSGSGFKAQ